MTIERHDSHPPEVICRPAGSGLCEPLPPEVPDLSRVSPGVLWYQAGGDPERYRDLMHEHGLLLRPGDEGYEDGSRNLACGWPDRGAAEDAF